MDTNQTDQSDPDRPASPIRPRTLYVSMLLKRAFIDAGGQPVGSLADVIVRLRGADFPVVTGAVVDLRGRPLFIPAAAITDWHTDRVELESPKVDMRAFERRDGEVLLKEDVLGHRLVDVEHARLVRAYDVQLTQNDRNDWEATGIDVHHAARLRWPGRHDQHAVRGWKAFEPLIGETSLMRPRGPRAWLGRLKPAEIADVLEDASPPERADILTQMHAHPELEADVFEELDEGQQSELLALRSDEEVADVLSRMRADDAADAIMELAPDRRQPILDRLTDPHRTKVMTLLGYHAASAGGLMSVDFLALADDRSASEALAAIRTATTMQWQAMTSVYCTDGHGRLSGVVTVVELIQADPAAPLSAIGDRDPVRVTADTDIVDLTLFMADHNLLTLPVVDDDQHVVGLITVDDALEASVPENWRRRDHGRRTSHAESPPQPTRASGDVQER